AAALANRESVALGLLYPAATILVLALAWRAPQAAGLTTGQFVAFHTAMFAFFGSLLTLTTTTLDVVNLKPLWDRARPVLETLPEDALPGRVRHDPTGAIRLEGVTFSYPDGP